jgi:hypothetical protein
MKEQVFQWNKEDTTTEIRRMGFAKSGENGLQGGAGIDPVFVPVSKGIAAEMTAKFKGKSQILFTLCLRGSNFLIRVHSRRFVVTVFRQSAEGNLRGLRIKFFLVDLPMSWDS